MKTKENGEIVRKEGVMSPPKIKQTRKSIEDKLCHIMKESTTTKPTTKTSNKKTVKRKISSDNDESISKRPHIESEDKNEDSSDLRTTQAQTFLQRMKQDADLEQDQSFFFIPDLFRFVLPRKPGSFPT